MRHILKTLILLTAPPVYYLSIRSSSTSVLINVIFGEILVVLHKIAVALHDNTSIT